MFVGNGLYINNASLFIKKKNVLLVQGDIYRKNNTFLKQFMVINF